MTKDEFEAYYAANSKRTVEQIRQYRVPRPCDCGDDTCLGWQMMSHEQAAIYDAAVAHGLRQIEFERRFFEQYGCLAEEDWHRNRSIRPLGA